jgi:hypothetical protein
MVVAESRATPGPVGPAGDGAIEIEFAAGARMRITGAVDAANRAGGPEVPEVFAVILMAAIQIPNSEWEDSAVKRNKFERS